MMLWLVAVPVAACLSWLVWWSSGRAKPDMRRRRIETEIALRERSVGGFDIRIDGGPGPDSGS
jgi:hypothetical protein